MTLSRALLLLLAAAPASAGWWPFSRALTGPDPLQETRALQAQGRHDEAVARLRELLDGKKLRRSEERRAYLSLARSLEAAGRSDLALGHLQLAAQLYPKETTVLLALAGLYHRVELEERARPLFERVLELDPNDADAHAGLADVYRHIGLTRPALRHFREALGGSRSGDADVWLAYARTLADQRDFYNAEQAAAKAHGLKPLASTLALKALYLHRQGRRPEALAALEEALAQSPLDLALRLQRALWLLKDGRLDEAEREAARVLAADPEDALAYWIRGAARLRAGDKEDALRQFWLAQANGKGFTGRFSEALAQALQKDGVAAAPDKDGALGRPR